MRRARARRFGPAVLALALGLNLAACETFDLTDLIPDTKKKLAGERKEVFPGGVPGVPQGVPQELVKGNNPAEDPNAAALEQARLEEERRLAEQKAAEEKARQQRARAQRAAAPRPAPQPEQQAAPQAQQPSQGSAWPNQQPQQPASAWPSSNQQQAGQSAWPAPPQSGTFSR